MNDAGDAGAQPSYHVRIQDLPAQERPRERLLQRGASRLSNAELLAILLGSGTEKESALDVAQRLLAERGLDGLQRAAAEELTEHRGVGPAKAAHIKAALELGQCLATLQPEARPSITSPEDVMGLLGAEMALLEQEELRALILDSKHQVLAQPTVYQGSVNRAQVRIAEILRHAVRRNAPALIAVHNHPSGDPTPSQDDVRMTRDLIVAGELLDVDVLDHVVIGAGKHVSLRGEGLLD